MSSTVFLLSIYMVFQLVISLWAWRLVRTEADYLLAGRRLGIFFASFSLFATWFGAETVVSSSALVADEGLAGARADPFGYALCLGLMALFVAAQLRSRDYVTIGDFFRNRFSRRTEILASVIILLTSLPWAAAQLQAFAQILSTITGAEFRVMLVISTVLVILYTSLGGLLADVMTDVVQGIFLILGLALLLGYVFSHAGGVSEGLAMIEPEQLSFVAPDESLFSRLDVWAVPVLGSLVSQEAISRLLATQSAATARKACFAGAGMYLVIGTIPVLIALIGTHFDFEIQHRDQFLPELAQTLLPKGLFIIFAGALISAILSTVDSTLLTFSSLTGHNLLKPFMSKISEARKVRIERLLVAGSGAAAFFIAMSGDTIFELVQLSSSFGTAGLLVCLFLGLWHKKGGEKLALTTIGAGLVATILGGYVLEIDAPFLTAIAVSLGVYVAGLGLHSLGAKKPV